MRIVKAQSNAVVCVSSVPNGECCVLTDDSVRQSKGGKAGVVYMKIKTSQQFVSVQKKENVFRGTNCAKLLNIETGFIACVPMSAEVCRVDAEVKVSRYSPEFLEDFGEEDHTC